MCQPVRDADIVGAIGVAMVTFFCLGGVDGSGGWYRMVTSSSTNNNNGSIVQWFLSFLHLSNSSRNIVQWLLSFLLHRGDEKSKVGVVGDDLLWIKLARTKCMV